MYPPQADGRWVSAHCLIYTAGKQIEYLYPCGKVWQLPLSTLATLGGLISTTIVDCPHLHCVEWQLVQQLASPKQIN